MRRADVVTALAALCLLAHCGGDGVPPQSASPGSAPRTAPRGRPGASSASEPGIDLQAMLAPVPEYAGQGRNLFEFGRERVAPPPRATSTAAPTTRPTTRPPTNPTPRVPTARAQRVDVKYAGFVEKTTAEGEKQKYAIFLDGNDAPKRWPLGDRDHQRFLRWRDCRRHDDRRHRNRRRRPDHGHRQSCNPGCRRVHFRDHRQRYGRGW